MQFRRLTIVPILLVALFISSCATFRSGIEGKFEGAGEKNYGAEKVCVLFIFSHLEQAKGYDAIPKLESSRQIIDDFDDLFIDAMGELSNIGRYSTYTEFASDVGDSRRRAHKDSMIASHDYIMKIKFSRENSFIQHFLSKFFSTVSATILPMPYSVDYSTTVEVFNSDDTLVKSYSREASLTKWVQTALIFIYPFHTERRKKEEIYIESLHDIFRQIETEKVLTR
ncbi:MAG: hypothetical protein P9M15_05535 [Candidatus Electryoneaceae bacterium]|nr:hypothetical protein [Candidatus Electryoneaceae bacterium]